MTPDEINQAWFYLRELWPTSAHMPSTEVEAEVREQVWLDLLGDVDAQVVRAAIGELSGQAFPPTPGQLRAAVDRLVLDAAGSGAPDPDEAWAEVKGAVARVGSRGTPEWSHPAVAAAVAALGWRDFCMSSTDDEATWRAHFLRFYGASSARTDRAAGIGPPPAVVALAGQLGASELKP